MDEKFIRDRITELRLQKDVPERKMSNRIRTQHQLYP